MSESNESIFTDYLLKLSNKNFDNLAYNYLGGGGANKNKHELANKLTLFLKEESTLEALRRYLSYEDRLILSAIAALNETSTGQIHELIPHLSHSQIILKVKNFRERLLIICVNSQDILNPVLQDFFAAEDIGPNFLLTANEDEEADEFWLDDAVMMLSLSLFYHTPENSKWEVQWESILPQVPRSRGEILHTAYHNLRLLTREGHPALDNVKNFAQLSLISRVSHILAAYIAPDYENFPKVLDVIYHILKQYQGHTCYKGIFERIYFLLEKKIPNVELSQRFLECELLQIKTTQTCTVKHLLPSLEDEPCLIIEGDQTAILSYQSPFILPVTLAFRPLYSDVFTHFQFDKTSFSVAFTCGYPLERFLEDIQKYLKSPWPPNLLTSIKTFEENSKRVKAYHGYFLQLDTDSQRRLSYNQTLEELALEIAPGMYWLKTPPGPKLSAAFKKAGLELPTFYDAEENHHYDFYHLDIEKIPAPSAFSTEDKALESLEKLSEIAKTPDQKILVHRRVILHEDQLKYPTPYTTITAQGTDFNHKINVIQQAIQNALYLEITLVSQEKQRTLIIIPKRIERHSNGANLVGVNYDTDRPVKLHIERLLQISTVKPSLLS